MKFNKTLIIPCKEEGENFTTILKRFEENIKNDTEIIIVLDSVEDSTYKFIENAETKAKMIINPKDGVASAINFGIESAEGNFICIAMGDGSDDPTQVEDLFMLVERGLSVAIASRYSKGGQFIGNKNLKYFLSKYSGKILNTFFFLGTKDPTNMFKAYDKAFLKDVGIQSENGFTLNFSDSTAISSMHLTDLAAYGPFAVSSYKATISKPSSRVCPISKFSSLD